MLPSIASMQKTGLRLLPKVNAISPVYATSSAMLKFIRIDALQDRVRLSLSSMLRLETSLKTTGGIGLEQNVYRKYWGYLRDSEASLLGKATTYRRN